MTVQELIDALSAYNPDANIEVWGTANAGTVDCELLPDIHTHEDRHADAATVHALLEIAEQLRLANLIALARGALPEHVPCEPDCTDVQEKAIAALVYFRRHAIPTGYPPVPEDYVTAHLLPDVAAALGIEPLDDQEQQ